MPASIVVPGKTGPLDLLVRSQSGALAVTRTTPPSKWDREWMITHIPTGYALLRAENLPAARVALRAMVALPIAWDEIDTPEGLRATMEPHRAALTLMRDTAKGKTL